ncbi:Zinc finger, CCCH-type [Trema orientale]|uniref:Zinc finger, CCCH-type n=1 Tax=Trema orientale TaxID=63057 RepID=A0A2P5FR77_TREOI|nr:Zinc finger, CCCH-type [Trema orientale]
MPVKKEVCRNFQRGSCQYGQRCKFLHVTSQQQKPPNNIFSYQQQQQQKPNPYGFGVQNNPQPKGAPDFGSKSNQFKPFENSWTRSSAHTATSTSEKQSQATNHKCTDPESCRRIIVEDFEQERPLWRLTCYGHWKNAPCDIVGDISYEELRAAAYDDAKRGLSLPSIVDRERNLVNSKVLEFENLCKSGSTTRNSTPANQNTFPVTGPNAFSQNAQGAPASVSSFSQLGTSLNMGFGPRHPAPLNNPVVQPNPFGVSGQTSSAFGIKDLSSQSQGSTFTPTPFFGNNSFMRAESNPFTTSTVSNQFLGATNNHSPVPFMGLNFSSNANGPVTTELQQGFRKKHLQMHFVTRNSNACCAVTGKTLISSELEVAFV